MEIRPFQDEDADGLAQIFFASVRTGGRLAYSAEQVAAWAPEAPDPARYKARAADGRILLVAVDDDGFPLAYGDLESDGHIDHLYCRPNAIGQGVASALYDRLEAVARERGISRLYVEASELARPLFERKGFSADERRDLEVRGVAIHNYAMSKRLA